MFFYLCQFFIYLFLFVNAPKCAYMIQGMDSSIEGTVYEQTFHCFPCLCMSVRCCPYRVERWSGSYELQDDFMSALF